MIVYVHVHGVHASLRAQARAAPWTDGRSLAVTGAVGGVVGRPLEALREGAMQWLAAHQGWLLVLDNVTGPRDDSNASVRHALRAS